MTLQPFPFPFMQQNITLITECTSASVLLMYNPCKHKINSLFNIFVISAHANFIDIGEL